MKFSAFILLSALFSASAAIASDNSTQSGADLIEQATAKTNIFALQSFEMKANIRVDIKGNPLDGLYSLLWNGPQQWKEEISFPGYSEIQVGSRGVVYIKRSTDFIPFRIFQLHSALGYGSEELSAGSVFTQASFFSDAPRTNETIKKIHERTIDGAKAECVEILTAEKHTREVCIAETIGTLIRQNFRDKDLMPIGSKVFPRSLSLTEDGKSVASVQVTELKTDVQFPASVFDPPPGAISRPGCMNPNPSQVSHRVEPHYPEEDKYAHRQGTVAIYGIIDKSGVPQGLRVVSSAGPSLDKASLDAIRQWRYQSATCDGNSVDTETVIEVHYRLSF